MLVRGNLPPEAFDEFTHLWSEVFGEVPPRAEVEVIANRFFSLMTKIVECEIYDQKSNTSIRESGGIHEK